jgi:hypothetical protein
VLLLVPATASAASSSALPGQALYPVKLAVEQFRLAAVQWSPTREAQERAKLAAKRLDELHNLVKFQMFRHVPPAIRALDKAVAQARAAVVEAAAEDGTDPKLFAAAVQVAKVEDAQHGELVALTTMVNQLHPANGAAITQAVLESPVVEGPRPPVFVPAPPTTAAPNSTGAPAPDPSAPATTQPEPTSPPSSAPEPTSPPPTDPPSTTAPPPTDPPPTTVVSEGTPTGDSPTGAGYYGGASPPSTLP